MDRRAPELADAIAELRRQLLKAQADAKKDADGRVRFAIAQAEVDIGLEAKYDAKAGTKLNFGVVAVDVGGGAASAATHHVRVKFKVSGADGGMLEVSDDGDDR